MGGRGQTHLLGLRTVGISNVNIAQRNLTRHGFDFHSPTGWWIAVALGSICGGDVRRIGGMLRDSERCRVEMMCRRGDLER